MFTVVPCTGLGKIPTLPRATDGTGVTVQVGVKVRVGLGVGVKVEDGVKLQVEVNVAEGVNVGLGWATITSFPLNGIPVNTTACPPLFPLVPLTAVFAIWKLPTAVLLKFTSTSRWVFPDIIAEPKLKIAWFPLKVTCEPTCIPLIKRTAPVIPVEAFPVPKLVTTRLSNVTEAPLVLLKISCKTGTSEAPATSFKVTGFPEADTTADVAVQVAVDVRVGVSVRVAVAVKVGVRVKRGVSVMVFVVVEVEEAVEVMVQVGERVFVGLSVDV